jgi:ABC-type Na+ efflux pump permease subunit
MNPKLKNIINWVLAGLVAFIFLGSAGNKLSGSEEALKMAESFGIAADHFRLIAIVELLAALLFLYPRTGLLGTLLLTAFMGGAIATHVEHAQSSLAPAVILAFVWIVTVIRFPEMLDRILGRQEKK